MHVAVVVDELWPVLRPAQACQRSTPRPDDEQGYRGKSACLSDRPRARVARPATRTQLIISHARPLCAHALPSLCRSYACQRILASRPPRIAVRIRSNVQQDRARVDRFPLCIQSVRPCLGRHLGASHTVGVYEGAGQLRVT
jgi:hypothetical protein